MRLLSKAEARGFDTGGEVEPGETEAAAALAGCVRDYCYLHALLLRRKGLDGFSALLSRWLSRLRRLTQNAPTTATLPSIARLARPFLLTALCALRNARTGGTSPAPLPASDAAPSAPSSSPDALAEEKAAEMVGSVFGALVPLLTLHVGSEGVTKAQHQPLVAEVLDSFLPVVMLIAGDH